MAISKRSFSLWPIGSISKRLGALKLMLMIVLTVVSHFVNSLGLAEPPDGKVYLAAWTDGSSPYNDSPSALNQRVGQSLYAFQFAQTIPITPYNYTTGAGGPINITQLNQASTQASLYLTVYPQTLDQVTDQDLNFLGQQILNYQSSSLNRQVFLRFAPEMQGTWMTYGLQPTKFLSVWRRMFTIVKRIAPKSIIVWAPNSAMGYPYSSSLTAVSSTADQELLDTNKNGQLDSNDNAYSPYYPGDSFVDWNGISWYWKGTEFPYRRNQLSPSGYTAGAMTGIMPAGALEAGSPSNYTNFYDTYCRIKPCMLSEMGAAFHTNPTVQTSVTQQTLQQAWWRDALTSNTFMDRFPKIKMFMLFEHEKPEDGGDMRDYRITLNDQIRTSWLNDFQAVQSRFIWADTSNNPQKAARGETCKLNISASTLILYLASLLVFLILHV